jgi:agmatinase
MSRPSQLALVSLPFEVTTAFQKGTVHGPAAVLHELEILDAFDMMFGRSPFDGVPRTVIRPHGPELTDPRLQQAIAGRIVGEILDGRGFPLCLGGEHTVSMGPIRAAQARGALGIVHLDARADLREEHHGDRFTHETVVRRTLEFGCSVLSVGVRAMSLEEKNALAAHQVEVITGRQLREGTDWYQAIDSLPQRVYLTIDLNVFDPEDVPAVSNPKPGGPAWNQVCDFLFHLFGQKDVVAADIVELSPGPGDASSVRLAARLVGLLTGLRFS